MENNRSDLIPRIGTQKRTIVCFTNDTWDSALCQVRLRGPLGAAGFNVIPGNEQEKKLLDDLSDADYVVIQRDFPQYIDLFLWVLQETRIRKTPLVYEIDDLLFCLPESHPLQKDGSYAKNFIPMLIAICRADLVTVSTEPLAKFIRPFNSNVRVLPNYLNDEFWEFMPVNVPEKIDSPITIGYIGGSTHKPDILMIVNALNRVQEQFGQKIIYKFWGVEPPQELISQFKIERQPIVAGYKDYAAAFRSQNIDILIAPLEDNLFNHSKSHLKYLEYSTLGVPGVFSRVKAFEDVVEHGVTGFLASAEDEWVECLRKLVSSSELRLEMAAKAQESVKRNLLLSDHAHEWAEAYTGIRDVSAGYQNSFMSHFEIQEELLKELQRQQKKEDNPSAGTNQQQQSVAGNPPKFISGTGRLIPSKLRKFLKKLFNKGH